MPYFLRITTLYITLRSLYCSVLSLLKGNNRCAEIGRNIWDFVDWKLLDCTFVRSMSNYRVKVKIVTFTNHRDKYRRKVFFLLDFIDTPIEFTLQFCVFVISFFVNRSGFILRSSFWILCLQRMWQPLQRSFINAILFQKFTMYANKLILLWKTTVYYYVLAVYKLCSNFFSVFQLRSKRWICIDILDTQIRRG